MDVSILPIIKKYKKKGLSGIETYDILIRDGYSISWMEFQVAWNNV